jgi:putative zinc finger protein
MTMHDEWTDRLSDYLDGELPDQENRAVAAHVAGCAECSRTLDELRAVVATAQSLTAIEPSNDLWGGIAERIASPEGTRPVLKGPWATGRRFSFTMPQIAAASLLLALLSGWAALRLIPGTSSADLQVRPDLVEGQVPPGANDVSLATVSFDHTEYDAAVAELERALQNGQGRLDPTTVKVVEDNLTIIDEAVDEARRALAEDPGNGYLSGYLVETERRKLALLQQAARLTELN